MTNNQSIASEDGFVETTTAPTFECVLDSDDDSVSVNSTPPIPVWRVQPKGKGSKAKKTPKMWMIEQADSVEIQTIPDYGKRAVERNGRKRYWMAAACILVALIILASVLGVKLSPEREDAQEGTDEQSFSSGVGPGAEEELTAAPTPAKTTAKTTPPTLAPSVCETMLVTTKQCYLVGEEIRLDFVNCDPSDEDWVGIFFPPAESDLSNYVDWLWTCGTQDCAGEREVMADTLLFVGLEAGTYEAHLSRNDVYESLAGEFDFIVADTC